MAFSTSLRTFRGALASALLIVLFQASLAAAAPEACNPTPDDTDFWDGIKNSTDPHLFLAYLQQFPAGCHRAIAVAHINAVVPARVSMHLEGVFSTGARFSTSEGVWIDASMIQGRPNWIKQIQITQSSLDPSQLQVQVQCDGNGPGLSPWLSSACYPAPTFLLGYSVRLVGPLSDFYDLQVNCDTKGVGPEQRQSVAAGEWCGVRSPSSGRYLNQIMVAIARKVFQ